VIEFESSVRGARLRASEENMRAKTKIKAEEEMLPEYDFTGAVRGKYYERYRQGTNVVLLDPDVAKVFRNADKVNGALRLLVSVADAKVASLRRGTKAPQQLNKPLRPGRLRTPLRTVQGSQRRTAKAARH